LRKASSWSRKLRLSCAGEGTAAVDRPNLEGQTILVIEGEVLIALDLLLVLERAFSGFTFLMLAISGPPASTAAAA